MQQIQEISLSKLLKLELPQFVKKVTNCIEEHNPEALKLQDALNLLIEQRSKMKLLIAPYGKHPLTDDIQQLHLERLKYVAAINMHMKLLNKVNYEGTESLIITAKALVYGHFNELRRNNQVTIHQTIIAFFLRLKENPEIKDALVDLGFEHYLNKLEETNNQCYELDMERNRLKSKRLKIDSGAIQKEAQQVLRAIFEQINFYQVTYKELDYGPLIAQLNELIVKFSSLIRTRTTANKTRKRKSKVKNALSPTTTISMDEEQNMKNLINILKNTDRNLS